MLRRYKKYKEKYQILYLLNIGMIILVKILDICEIVLVGSILDNLIRYKSMRLLKYNCLCWLFLFTAVFLLENISQYVGIYLNTKIDFDMKKEILEKIHKVPILRWSDTDKVEMSQRLELDVSIICSYILNVPITNFINAVYIIIAVLILTLVNRNILIILFAIIFIYLFLYSKTRTMMGEAYKNFQEQESFFYSRVNEQIQLLNFIKLHSVKGKFSKRLNEAFKEYCKYRMKLQRISILFTSCDSIVDVCMQILVYLWAGKNIIEGALQPGTFVIILGLYSVVMGSIKYFYHLGEMIQNARSADERIMDILSSEEETYGEKREDTIYEIEFQNVEFAFGSKKIIRKFNHKFVRGNIYGVIGENGIGKSTLIQLLLNVYQYQGKILYNGIDSQEYDLPFLRKYLFGITEQASVMIPESVYENIAFSEKVDKEEIIILAQILGMDKVVERLSKKWDTIINENGNNLSGGEKKLISIMRELVKKPDVLIFDEPTNELDHEKKEQFLEFILKNKKKRITIIISHDQNIEKYCDEIIVIGDKNKK